jgi:hypothetical protein
LIGGTTLIIAMLTSLGAGNQEAYQLLQNASGIAYGLALYLAMNFVVMPLSAIHATGGKGPLYIVITGVLVHMFLVGLPIALMARWSLRSR